ncbi:NAD(P)-dependent dehydrogenase (short-subunit alcohol dehydrogenase family) [Leucobacter exalbidus]|uniref:NAD(P)-dependent dehydrogenase (Short-subunit alcohol dehydrogenase family) n=1 Tax=Leucobacter exalbidus TaxID=662960 RepID=A0A940T5Z2_9MICO|nr:SDR family oxidoreductase [Leucobacter exalbidus]MBP1326461.1 NAD(P)-dependent dehydrogenase (short-subunit alcohol dehydrogenase family) [Leucobacter exalbidus]
MQALMQGKIVLVTGGTQGLGLAVAEAAAREGAAGVVIVGRSAAKAEIALAAIAAAGSGAAGNGAEAAGAEGTGAAASGVATHAVLADLSVEGEAERAVAETIAHFGRIDSLVNAAGATSRGTLLDTSRELLNDHLTLNLVVPFMTMQGAVADMQSRGAPGTIVNVITMSMHGGQPYLAPYVASKAGLAGLTKNAAFAHRFDRIRINGLNIGWTATPGEAVTQHTFHGAAENWLDEASAAQPMGKLGQPEEIADAIVFLLSERSGVVTGSIIDWDQNVPGAYE